MRVPYPWLKKYIDVSLSPERLAEALTMSGTAVERVEKSGGEAVLEIEVTTNRPDCLSILGVAQEVAALTGKKSRLPKRTHQSPRSKPSSKLTIDVQDRKGCPKYTGRLLRQVAVGPAPSEAQRFLELVGTRPISNVVDATNFVLFEIATDIAAKRVADLLLVEGV